MTVGFQLLLADGVTVQADDKYRNLTVREKGSVATTNLSNAGGTSFVVFYRTGLTMPLIAVAGTGFAVGQIWFDTVGNRWGIMLVSGGDVGTQVPYFIFDVPFDTDPHLGLQVFNTSGQKTFDIMQKYMRINDMYSASARPTTTRNYDASRTYACIHMQVGFSISAQAGNTMLYATRVSAGVVAGQGIIVDGAQGISTINEGQAMILVIDVSNY